MSLKKKDYKEAESCFEKIQNETTDSSEKYDNELLFLYWKYLYGAINTIEKLKLKAENAPQRKQKLNGLTYLAECFIHNKNYNEGIVIYNKCLAICETEVETVNIITELSECYYNNGEKEKGLEVLYDAKTSLSEGEALSKLYLAISTFFDKEGDQISKALALEMVINYEPANKTHIFNTALEYSTEKCNMEVLALIHYLNLLSYDAEYASGLNNVGVSYGRLGLMGNSVKYFKKAEELKQTLAAANLASKLLNIGFYEEAKSYLLKAKDQKDVHENVWNGLKEIAKKENEELEKENKIFREGNDFQVFLRRFNLRYFTKITCNNLFQGDWLCENSKVKISILPNPIYYGLIWSNDKLNFDISIPIANSVAVIGFGNSSPKGGGLSNKLNVFAYFNETKDILHTFLYDTRDHKGYLFDIKNESPMLA